MTTIEIIKKAKIDSVNKAHKSITVTGIDTITGRIKKRTFNYLSPKVLDKAEQFVSKNHPSLVVEVDSGTKNIDLRDDSKASQHAPNRLQQFI